MDLNLLLDGNIETGEGLGVRIQCDHCRQREVEMVMMSGSGAPVILRPAELFVQ